MAKPPSPDQSHGTFFITAPTHNRRRIFQATRNADLLVDTLHHYSREGNFILHAFVIMPDHIHLLIETTGTTIQHAMQLIKGGFSHRLASRLPVWQRGYTSHLVLTPQEFTSRRDYIHNNPVRAHLTHSPEAYPHSSAYRPEPNPHRN